jgi:predicted nuclease of predicted toxin-antitoxin system
MTRSPHGNAAESWMPSRRPRVRYLLDKHYPGWLAEALTADGIDTVALTAHRTDLRGADDKTVLEAAVAERRVVVTEDVTTFSSAIALTGPHVGVVYCHHARFPRTAPGLQRLHHALTVLAQDPPEGLGQQPVEWWLAVPADDAEE